MFQVREKDHPTEVGKPTLYGWLMKCYQNQEPLLGSSRVFAFSVGCNLHMLLGTHWTYSIV